MQKHILASVNNIPAFANHILVFVNHITAYETYILTIINNILPSKLKFQKINPLITTLIKPKMMIKITTDLRKSSKC